MAGDSFALNSDQRENGIACSAQIVDQVRFGGLEECGLFNETDRLQCRLAIQIG